MSQRKSPKKDTPSSKSKLIQQVVRKKFEMSNLLFSLKAAPLHAPLGLPKLHKGLSIQTYKCYSQTFAMLVLYWEVTRVSHKVVNQEVIQ